MLETEYPGLYGQLHAYWCTGSLTLKWLGYFFQNMISLFDAVHLMCNIFFYETGQYNECLVSIVDTDGLVR